HTRPTTTEQAENRFCYVRRLLHPSPTLAAAMVRRNGWPHERRSARDLLVPVLGGSGHRGGSVRLPHGHHHPPPEHARARSAQVLRRPGPRAAPAAGPPPP